MLDTRCQVRFAMRKNIHANLNFSCMDIFRQTSKMRQTGQYLSFSTQNSSWDPLKEFTKILAAILRHVGLKYLCFCYHNLNHQSMTSLQPLLWKDINIWGKVAANCPGIILLCLLQFAMIMTKYVRQCFLHFHGNISLILFCKFPESLIDKNNSKYELLELRTLWRGPYIYRCKVPLCYFFGKSHFVLLCFVLFYFVSFCFVGTRVI